MRPTVAKSPEFTGLLKMIVTWNCPFTGEVAVVAFSTLAWLASY